MGETVGFALSQNLLHWSFEYAENTISYTRSTFLPPLIIYCNSDIPNSIQMEERGDLRGYGRGIYPSHPIIPTIPLYGDLHTLPHLQ